MRCSAYDIESSAEDINPIYHNSFFCSSLDPQTRYRLSLTGNIYFEQRTLSLETTRHIFNSII